MLKILKTQNIRAVVLQKEMELSFNIFLKSCRTKRKMTSTDSIPMNEIWFALFT